MWNTLLLFTPLRAVLNKLYMWDYLPHDRWSHAPLQRSAQYKTIKCIMPAAARAHRIDRNLLLSSLCQATPLAPSTALLALTLTAAPCTVSLWTAKRSLCERGV